MSNKNGESLVLDKDALMRLTDRAENFSGPGLMGYVFEEMVRAEERYGHAETRERQLEDFIFACLENRDGLDLLSRKLWHIPDALGFRFRRNRVYISRIVEIKSSLHLRRPAQMWKHESDLAEALKSINYHISKDKKQGKIPDCLWEGKKKIMLDKRIERELVIPSDCPISEEKRAEMETVGWTIHQSGFSLDEAIVMAKKLFPHQTGDLRLRGKSKERIEEPVVVVNSEPVLIEQWLKPAAKILEGLLVGRGYQAKDLLETALIWILSDHILVDIETAKTIVNLETVRQVIQTAPNQADLPARIEEFRDKMEEYFCFSNDGVVMAGAWQYYQRELLPKLIEIHKFNSQGFTFETILDFI